MPSNQSYSPPLSRYSPSLVWAPIQKVRIRPCFGDELQASVVASVQEET